MFIITLVIGLIAGVPIKHLVGLTTLERIAGGMHLALSQWIPVIVLAWSIQDWWKIVVTVLQMLWFFVPLILQLFGWGGHFLIWSNAIPGKLILGIAAVLGFAALDFIQIRGRGC